ncbi:MAG: hypothetical protein HOE90_25045 [Bacteriovoracaceae bacterium]|jgi:hypothetical protein|nr:hypothetical protein [Bacteriovoracaceae bacterium]
MLTAKAGLLKSLSENGSKSQGQGIGLEKTKKSIQKDKKISYLKMILVVIVSNIAIFSLLGDEKDTQQTTIHQSTGEISPTDDHKIINKKISTSLIPGHWHRASLIFPKKLQYITEVYVKVNERTAEEMDFTEQLPTKKIENTYLANIAIKDADLLTYLKNKNDHEMLAIPHLQNEEIQEFIKSLSRGNRNVTF